MLEVRPGAAGRPLMRARSGGPGVYWWPSTENELDPERIAGRNPLHRERGYPRENQRRRGVGRSASREPVRKALVLMTVPGRGTG
ncbi:hypothetical protein GCM10028799_55680 [Kribbella italica]